MLRNSLEMDELESDVWFSARDRVEHEAGPGFSKIEPYKHVITRCRKQVEAKKRIRPWRVHGDAMFAPLHVNPCVYERSREHVSRDKTNLKLFMSLSLSLSLSLFLCLEWYSRRQKIGRLIVESRSRTRDTTTTVCQVIRRFLNEPRKSYKSRETRESIMAFFPSYTRFNEPFLRWLSRKFPVDISFPM